MKCVYDETGNQFVFKFNVETETVDLLDVGKDVFSQGRGKRRCRNISESDTLYPASLLLLLYSMKHVVK
ncbi:hypothetical protein GCK32_002237 [Trichostrongylus colubriformis]|uniref:Uncharacterized protein n=1 Tax=Trichostrongylus colubriformis TaxID=6319 RepID=A0AAN8ISY5_TRICO